jgi:hypothetical protein
MCGTVEAADHDAMHAHLSRRSAAGTTLTLDLAADERALWPDMIAVDNSFYGLSFIARSPRRGAVADLGSPAASSAPVATPGASTPSSGSSPTPTPRGTA